MAGDQLTITIQRPTLTISVGAIPVNTGGGVTDGDKGDVTVSNNGATWTVDPLPESRITNLVADLASLANAITALSTQLLNEPKHVRLSSDVVESSGSPTDTGLAFTPAANSTYLVEVWLAWKTAATTTGLQWTFSGPTSGATLQAQVQSVFNTTTAELARSGAFDAMVAGTGESSTAIAYIARGAALVVTGASPSGTVKVQVQTEVPASAVTILTGSVLRYTLVA